MPKWATPERRTHLVKLFLESGGFCVFGHRPCPNPEAHHYSLFIEAVIADWKADDRAQTEAEWRAEAKALRWGIGPNQGPYDAVARDAFHAEQPTYYFDGLGISGLTFKPFAKVRVASSYVNLFVEVDLGDALKGMSKAKRRKAIRYGKPLPQAVMDRIGELCLLAVRRYLA